METVWLANGIYPGWQTGARPSLDDPREPAPSPEEVGRGPLPEEMGRFNAVRLVPGGVVLEYAAGGASIREWMTLSERRRSSRHRAAFPRRAVDRSAVARAGVQETTDRRCRCSGGRTRRPRDAAGHSRRSRRRPSADAATMWAVRIPPHNEPIEFGAALADGGRTRRRGARDSRRRACAPAGRRKSRPREPCRPRRTPTSSTTSRCPLDNPWRRNVRPGDIQFLQDGTGVSVTLDGDVWLVRGLHEPAGPVRWKRFASGLHEPMTLAIRDEQIYVFDRNGIWRLRDTNGDGEADVHELFSNAFAQTADMREFPSTLRLAPARRVRDRQGRTSRRRRSGSTTGACCASRRTAAARRCWATGSGSRTSA